MSNKNLSNWWYVVPVLFGIIGGVVSYFILKGKNKEFAESMLIVGVVVTVITFIMNIVTTPYIPLASLIP